MEKRLQFDTDTDSDTDTYSISSIRHRTAAYEHLRLQRNDDQHIHFVCRAEVNIATEKRLQFRRATVQQVMPISIPTQTHLRIRTHTLDYSSIHHRTTDYEHLRGKGKQWSSATFVERKSTTPWRSVSNFDTGSTTHDWDREAAYENQRRSSWLEQYLRYSSTRYRSRYNRTVCHLRRSGWLEVKTVEADSTIDYRAQE